MADILGTGLAFPLGVDRRGNLALAHGEDDVEQAIEIILGTVPGERPMRPEFGCRVHEVVFEAIDAATAARVETEVRAALDRWEPRIEVVEVLVHLHQADEGVLHIEVAYRLRATNHLRNLVHPFYVIPAEESA